MASTSFYKLSLSKAELNGPDSVKLVGRGKSYDHPDIRKMVCGDLYNSLNPVPQSARDECVALCNIYNIKYYEMDPKQRLSKLREILGSVGEGTSINPAFRCDYGFLTDIGKNVDINYNLTILDCSYVKIGDNTLIAPNVTISAASHPTAPDLRRRKIEFAYPITICDNVWIGANVCVCPGVTIGENSVIGAGSVVTRDIGPNSVAVGSPCKVIRRIDSDGEWPFEETN
eukprot:GHVN01074937.1.p1 GENE.GHVN01074937.1~~GHVN01074937.1.p1  ORF type:complete len:229 (-),score=26.11 GHVN01074937.1:86-772(-)